MISGQIVEGRDTLEINQALYLEYFAAINKIPADQLHLTIENEAFKLYQMHDTLLSHMGHALQVSEDKVQESDRSAPDLLEKTKSKAAEHETIESQMAKLQSLKINLDHAKKNYAILKPEAMNALNASLLNINNAPGEHGVDEMTPKELGRQTPILNRVKLAHQEIVKLTNEISDVHNVITDYNTVYGTPKLKEVVAPDANVVPAKTGANKPG